jgi:tRNA(fMet)-specific endonuclease VapC
VRGRSDGWTIKLLDTSVVVDIDRGDVDRRVAKLDDEGRHAVSMVTVTELRLGLEKRYGSGTDAYDQTVDDLDRLLARLDVRDVSRPVALAATDIIADLHDRGQPLHDLHEVYVAATARTERLHVLTANVDHFDRIEHVTVVDWSEF